MTNAFRLSLTGTIIFSLFLSLIPAVSAHQDTATTYLPASFSSWSTFGSPSVSSERVVIEGSQKEWVYIDLKATDIDESYFAIASYVDKSDSRTSYTSTQRNNSGNPYIYAYELDSNGKIVKYLSGTSLMSTTRSDSDHVVYGIFSRDSSMKTVRVFLKQTSVSGISNSGVNVEFARPILVEASSSSRAKDLVTAYANQSLSFTYKSATSSSGTSSTSSTSSTSTSTTTNCAATNGTNIFKIGFEPNESRDGNLQFGSSFAAWIYATHDYLSSVFPYDRTTTAQSYTGSYALGLSNSNYGNLNGEVATSPQPYDEALRYIATNKLVKDGKYAFSIRAKYAQGSSSQSSVSFYLSQETGSSGSGQVVNTKLVNANDSWQCLEYQFTNKQSGSTAQDLVVFFGTLPKGATLYIDDIQLIKR